MDKIEEVIELYSDSVYRLAYSMVKNRSDADDIYQEVFLSYIKSDKTFQSEEHRKAWLLRVTINCCKKLFRSAWRNKVIPFDDSQRDGKYYDKHDEMSDILNTLPMKYKTVIHLYYYEDMSVESIAKLTQQKEGTVRTQLSRARQLLKERLEEDEL